MKSFSSAIFFLQVFCATCLNAVEQDLYLDSIKKSIIGLEGLDVNHPNFHSHWRSSRLTIVNGGGLDTLIECMQTVHEEKIPGDFLEAGVWKGGVTILMKAFLNAVGDSDRKVYVADSFQGWQDDVNDPAAGLCNNRSNAWIIVPKSDVEANFRKYNLLDDKVEFIEGFFHESLKHASVDRLAILRLDSDLYESTKVSLEELYPKLSIGGYVIIDDYHAFPSCDRAVNEFREKWGITDVMYEQYKEGGPGVYWRKTHD
jgi:O-methyltransferase